MRFATYLGNTFEANKRIARGGIGEVLETTTPFLFKRYFNPKTLRVQTTLQMLQSPPSGPPGADLPFCLPQDLVQNSKGEWIGFLMQDLREEKYIELSTFADPILRDGLVITFSDLLLVAERVSLLLACLHQQGYRAADLKPENIFINTTSLWPTFIDCDGFEVSGCPKSEISPDFTPVYAPPEAFEDGFTQRHRSRAADNFSLAACNYFILAGCSPWFAPGKLSPTPKAMISDGLWLGRARPNQTPASLRHPSTYLDSTLLKGFKRAFEGKKQARPKAKEWAELLSLARKNLVSCCKSPAHQFCKGLSECPWCASGKPDLFPSSIPDTGVPKDSSCKSKLTFRKRTSNFLRWLVSQPAA